MKPLKKTKNIIHFLAIFTVFSSGANAALLAHWTFDENAGTTAADSSGNGLTATGTNDWTTGVSGSAALNPKFTLADSSSLALADGNTAFTISLWAKTTTNDDFAILAGFEGTGTGGDRYGLKVHNNGDILVSPASIPVTEATAAGKIATLSNDSWIHIVGVNDPTAGNSRVYINGVQSGASGTLISLSSTTEEWTMGTYWNSGAYDYTGALDDVQVYDEALSTSDISFLFNNAGTAIPEPSSLALLGLSGLALLRRRRA